MELKEIKKLADAISDCGSLILRKKSTTSVTFDVLHRLLFSFIKLILFFFVGCRQSIGWFCIAQT